MKISLTESFIIHKVLFEGRRLVNGSALITFAAPPAAMRLLGLGFELLGVA